MPFGAFFVILEELLRMNKKVLTLCLVQDVGRILLGKKKRGFGAGKWNGFGGKVEPGETIEEAAKRELREESGLEAQELEQCGRLVFEFQGDPVLLDVHIFRVLLFTGKPQETEEMQPQWFFHDEIPFAEMWLDDPYWMPLFFLKRKFEGEFLFEGHDKILKYDIRVVESLT